MGKTTLALWMSEVAEIYDLESVLIHGGRLYDPNIVREKLKLIVRGPSFIKWIIHKIKRKSLMRYIVIVDDVTDVVRASRLSVIGDMARQVAHDIKNPLGAIVGFSDLLMKHYKELMEKDKIEYIKDINLSSKQLLNLLENLLEWSRSQTGKLQLSPDIFDLSYIINSCITLLQTNAESKNIRLFSEVKKGMKVFVDVETITTVIRNLITNAIKFTNFGGEVKITAQDIEDYIQVEINDNGVGINEDDISKLFRIDVSYSTQGTAGEKGTGLGLILCKEFIKKNSGKIWVESQIGKGSTFKFTLPKFRQ